MRVYGRGPRVGGGAKQGAAAHGFISLGDDTQLVSIQSLLIGGQGDVQLDAVTRQNSPWIPYALLMATRRWHAHPHAA